MKETAIDIKNLSKHYELSNGERFDALKDINLSIQKGEIMGLIGANGAGKSTLLKILSRITAPSEGNIKITGSLASLLEVGTGFHAELSGRENIYLNGSILGMRKDEIKKRFDEIVEFSGVGKFIDTPVKHYSSGMYVRLAFSVAAHLDSDILLIDEVLAVGDAEFQQKCLRKMSEATRHQERTVVFVSHNMSIARSLCQRIAYLEEGKIKKTGTAEEVTDFYLRRFRAKPNETPLAQRLERKGTGDAIVTGISIYQPNTNRESILICGETAEVKVDYKMLKNISDADLNFQLHIFNEEGNFLTTLSNLMAGKGVVSRETAGAVICRLHRIPLMPGRYYFNFHLFVNSRRADAVTGAGNFEVLEGDYYQSGSFYKRRVPGIFIEQEWIEAGN